MFKFLSIVAGFGVVGCASTSTMPLATDVVQITARAAPACGAEGAEKLAFRQAAAETINRGFDKFLILNGQYQCDTFVAGYTPAQVNTTASVNAHGYGNSASAHGTSNTTFTGGAPIHMTKHNQGLIVKMYKADDLGGEKAIDARQTLGPDWRNVASEKKLTCLSMTEKNFSFS